MAQAERELSVQHHNVERVALGNLSIGIYKPDEFITNEDIEEWNAQTKSGNLLTAQGIRDKIGIARRFWAGKNETTIDMGEYAARAAGNLENVDAIFVSTSYPIGKNVSLEIGNRLGIKIQPELHLDIHAACSGFVRGLAYMKEHEKEFQGKKVLFVATEKYSDTLVDLRKKGGSEIDRSIAQTIFSDGATAIIFRYGIDIHVLEYENIKLPEKFNNYLRMPIDRTLMVMPFIEEPIPNSSSLYLEQDGPHVFQRMLSYVPALNKRVVEKGIQPSDIKLVIPHQASGPMINGLEEKMSDFTLFKDLEDGNFSSASIPKALMRAIREGKIQRGNKILLSAFGAGLFASSAVIEFG